MSLELLTQIFEVCIIPLLGVLTAFLVAFIKRKTTEITAREEDALKEKYVNMLSKTIQEAVVSTNQTYTDSLKAKGRFDEDAQEEAFKQTHDKVMAILTREAREYLTEVYSDLDAYITTKIEAEVRIHKVEVKK